MAAVSAILALTGFPYERNGQRRLPSQERSAGADLPCRRAKGAAPRRALSPNGFETGARASLGCEPSALRRRAQFPGQLSPQIEPTSLTQTLSHFVLQQYGSCVQISVAHVLQVFVSFLPVEQSL